MNVFWDLWVIFFTVITLLFIAILIIYINKNICDVPEGQEMNHEYDGIKEINNPLPRWWVKMFWMTIIFAVIYMLLYPSFTNFKGILNWQSSEKNISSKHDIIESLKHADKTNVWDGYIAEMKLAEQKYDKVLKKILYDNNGKKKNITELVQNLDAIQIGQNLFEQNCSQCHGINAQGQKSFPNLTDSNWIHGDSLEQITNIIKNGKINRMPPWQNTFTNSQIKDLVSYVLSLSGRTVNLQSAESGKKLFTACAGCHGTSGQGNIALGAPNLTDQNWLYGGSRDDVYHSIALGRKGVMPAWGEILSENKILLIIAYLKHFQYLDIVKKENKLNDKKEKS